MRVLLLAVSLMLVAQVAVAAPKEMGNAPVAGNYKNKIQCGYLALEMRKNAVAKQYFTEGEALFKEQNPKATEMDLAKVFSYERGFLHGYLAGQMSGMSSMGDLNKLFSHAYENMCKKASDKPQLREKE
ncbi:hypothetical protein [Halodesulfovibrio sp.]|uniref:hypothetical protein n=1 Tax=Halodesulfovibrio sp. TaxID=1912772 RepID=UPI0025E66B41|nr:hypothetical protein [Halodesulfovibrio sp.]MCT4535618.1 hypothetical protein [Halodesulfovibrio sp.]